jgi:hypothetical protein
MRTLADLNLELLSNKSHVLNAIAGMNWMDSLRTCVFKAIGIKQASGNTKETVAPRRTTLMVHDAHLLDAEAAKALENAMVSGDVNALLSARELAEILQLWTDDSEWNATVLGEVLHAEVDVDTAVDSLKRERQGDKFAVDRKRDVEVSAPLLLRFFRFKKGPSNLTNPP